MRTKVGYFAEGVVEAVWLTAIIVIPLFFNIFSSRVFEPDKIILLRSLTWVAIAAWAIVVLDKVSFLKSIFVEKVIIKENIQRIWKQPFIKPVILFIMIYTLATIFSVTPLTSFWGSYQRLQGAYAVFSYLVLFVLVASFISKVEQIERIITFAIVVSFPISLYGVIQRYGLDPIPWAGNVASRITSTMGNSIFISAYLIMVFPFTLARIIRSFKSVINGANELWVNLALASCYIVIGSMQLLAIYFSGSRGPWLGFGASIVIIWLGISFVWKKRIFLLSGIIILGFASLFLIILNIAGGPLENIRSTPGLGRLGQLLDSGSRTGKVRTLIWQGVVQLVQPHDPLEYPDGSTDKLNILRPFIGYGPESMFVANNRYYQPGLTEVEKRNATPDRSHNETWDTLIFTGLFGTVIYLFLFGSIIYYGFQWLGLIQSKKRRNLFIWFYLLGGMSSSIFFFFWKGIHFLGVALPFGMVLSIFIFMVYSILNKDISVSVGSIDHKYENKSLLIIGILAAITAHFVELNFGFGIAATRLYFWVFLGILYAIGTRWEKITDGNSTLSSEENLIQDVVNPSRKKSRRNPDQSKNKIAGKKASGKFQFLSSIFQDFRRQSLLSGLFTGLILGTIGFSYLSNDQVNQPTIRIFFQSLFPKLSNSSTINYSLLGLLFISLVLILIILVSENVLETHTNKFGQMFLISVFCSILIFILFSFTQATLLSKISVQNPTTVNEMLDQVSKYQSTITIYFIFMLLIVLFSGFFLITNWPKKVISKRLAFSIPIIIILIMGIIYSSNIKIVQADIAFKSAESFNQPNLYPAAIAIYNHALELAPNEDYYYLFLARTYLEQARTMDNNASQLQLLEKAENDIRKAQRINPLNTDHTANLARLYSAWADFTSDQEEKSNLLRKSFENYEKAVTLSPNNSRLWGEWAFMMFKQLNDFNGAEITLGKALQLDPKYDWLHTIQGDYYLALGEKMKSDSEKSGLLYKKSLASYQESLLLLNPSDSASKFKIFLSIGSVYTRLGLLNEAINSYLSAIEIYPNSSDTWRVMEVLSRLYQNLDDIPQAIHYLEQAKEKAPESQIERLGAAIEELRNKQ